MKPFKTIKYRAHVITLVTDDYPESPREWDNVGEILYTSSHYTLGDRRTTKEEIADIIERKDAVFLPVYAYIHSSTSLSTTPFHYPWDSGQCGIIWCPKEKALQECTSIKKALDCLRGEIITFNHFLQENVIRYEVQGPYSQDSCSGFYPDEAGTYDYVIQEAKSNIDHAYEVTGKKRKFKLAKLRLEKEQHYALF